MNYWGLPPELLIFSHSIKPTDSLKNPWGDSLRSSYFLGFITENQGDSLEIHQGVCIFQGTHR